MQMAVCETTQSQSQYQGKSHSFKLSKTISLLDSAAQTAQVAATSVEQPEDTITNNIEFMSHSRKHAQKSEYSYFHCKSYDEIVIQWRLLVQGQ